MNSGAIQYRRLDAEELAADTPWWEIYEECFPLAEEREQPNAIIESVRAGVGMAFHAHESGQTIAIARTHALSNGNDFLAYIGVTESYRRRGVADALFRFLPTNKKIFEVGDPEHATRYGTTADYCWKRIRWYQKHFGAVQLDHPYLQPPLVDGSDPIPFRLMWAGEQPKPEQIRKIIWEIYNTFYHQANGVAMEEVERCFARVSEQE